MGRGRPGARRRAQQPVPSWATAAPQNSPWSRSQASWSRSQASWSLFFLVGRGGEGRAGPSFPPKAEQGQRWLCGAGPPGGSGDGPALRLAGFTSCPAIRLWDPTPCQPASASLLQNELRDPTRLLPRNLARVLCASVVAPAGVQPRAGRPPPSGLRVWGQHPQCWRLEFKFNLTEMKENDTFSSSAALATFQALTSHAWMAESRMCPP